MKTICAIDPGFSKENCTTVVFGDNPSFIKFSQHHIDWKIDAHCKRMSRYIRWKELADSVCCCVIENMPDVVVVEAPAFGAKFGSADMSAFSALIRVPLCDHQNSHGLQYYDLNISQWKQFICQNGRGQKDEVMAGLEDIGFGWIDDHNLADSIAMYLFGHAVSGQFECNEFQAEIVERFLNPPKKTRKKKKKR